MSPMNDPVIYVIDDDDSVRDSLNFLLSSSQFLVKTYDSASAFLESLSDIAFGCIITDVRMPGLSGIELLRRLRELQIKIPVIVVTGHGDVPLAVEAMKFGAADFFEKPFDSDSIVAAVRTALNNSERDADREAQKSELRDRLATLTPRERDVLEGLVEGKPNKTIAYDLGISPRTVEIYRANVMTKMSSGSLSELVRMVLLAGPLSS
jgi:two-component system, LuxR family, response regulator FixJ